MSNNKKKEIKKLKSIVCKYISESAIDFQEDHCANVGCSACIFNDLPKAIVNGGYGYVNRYRSEIKRLQTELAHREEDLIHADEKVFTHQHKYGKIVTDKLHGKFLAGADITLPDGRTVQFAFSYGTDSHEPMVTLGNKTFVLSWEDIVELADSAGLFDDDEVTA